MELLNIKPVSSTNRSVWRGLSNLKPKLDHGSLPNQSGFQRGSIVLILKGEYKGKNAVVIRESGNGVLTVFIPSHKETIQIDECLLVYRGQNININQNGEVNIEEIMKNDLNLNHIFCRSFIVKRQPSIFRNDF